MIFSKLKKSIIQKFILISNNLFRLIYRKKNPKLPELFFLIGTAFFPQLNVELLIRYKDKKTLYLWRDDEFGNKGWHLPGGIIRPNETILKRVKKVLEDETIIRLSEVNIHGPISFSEVIHKKPGIRSHFNSLVYLIEIKKGNNYLSYSEAYKGVLITNKIPKKLIKNHKRYIHLLSEKTEVLKRSSLDISNVVEH